MNRKLLNLFTLALLIILPLLFGAPPPAHAAGNITVIGNFPQSNDSTQLFLGGSNRIAVSFTMNSTKVNLTQVNLRLTCQSMSVCPTPTVTLQANSGSVPSGIPLVTFSGPATLDVLNVANTYTFTISSSYILNVGTKYWLVVEGGSDADIWNGSLPSVSPTGTYAALPTIKTDTGSGWTTGTSFPSFELTGYLTDVVRPDTFIDSGPSDTVYTYQTYSATFTYHGTDEVTQDPNFTFECFLSPVGSSYQVCNGGSITYNLDLGGQPNIQYIFNVRAVDEAGNPDDSSASQTLNLIADRAAPTTTFTSLPDTPTTSTSATFGFTGSDNITPVDNLTYECRLDENEAARETCSSPKIYSVLEGSHTFDVWAIDEFGNKTADGARYQWAVDLTAPDTSIDSVSPSSTSSTRSFITFNFSSPDATARLECSRDGAGWLSCSSPVAYTGFGLGAHTFAVRAIDQAGNADDTPASYAWTVVSPRERSKNGGFDTYTGSSKTPKNWKPVRFGLFDGKDTQTWRYGQASVRFLGGGTAAKTLTQTLFYDGLAGDVFKFTYSVRSSLVPKGGTCSVQVLLYNGSALVGKKEARCPSGSTYNWKPVKASLTASKPYTRVVIVFTVQKSGGIIWFDGFSLKQ